MEGRHFCCRASLTLRLRDSAWKHGFLTRVETFRRHIVDWVRDRGLIRAVLLTCMPLASKVRDRVSRQIHLAQVQAIQLIPINNIFKAVRLSA